ncbi:VWA domain-containing protein [Fulvivirga lutea]|uniref:VWA domain-containing protein n=1 Tax=Fulvivirga lutea TaxID=2810512 RepID=A0A975A1U0_9BACT|nr:VWA domain-containing protein [Fulvivirga lutea]QSE97857.1 VWA domain-containing protein [Fulvivirga lutea]
MKELIFDNHPLFLIVCLVVGAAYALIQYQKKGPWSKSMNLALLIIRGVLVSLICALLVSPIIRQIINETEAPAFVIAVDNSKSMLNSADSTALGELIEELKSNQKRLGTAGFETEFRTLSGITSEIRFNEQRTDLSELLEGIQSDYEGRNIAGVLLVSDGMYNSGISPTFSEYGFPISTLLIGDTIPKADISIHSILFNRLAYQGNKFPVVINILNEGYVGEQIDVNLMQNGQRIAQQKLTLTRSGELQEVKFLVDAKESGFQKYEVVVSRKENELTYSNNYKSAFIEVVEGKETIALLAGAPHPDIKALRSAIQTNSNYEFESYILSNPKDVERLKNSPKNFDLVIYHELTDAQRFGQALFQEVVDKEEAALIFFGPQVNVKRFNDFNEIVKVSITSDDYDKIIAAFNPAFGNFKLSEELQSSFDQFPPISVPFGNYQLESEASTLLYQRVGNITTSRPLLSIKANGDKKRAVFLGQGLWKWKLTDYANNGNNNLFNELVSKLVQYLSTKDDKRKFRVYPIKNEFSNTEDIVFETEVYNDLYEEVYDQKIDLILKNEKNETFQYDYITNPNNTRYVINGLKDGIYSYVASTELNGKREEVKGEIIVKELQLENQNYKADFAMLRKLASQTGGKSYKATELSELSNYIENKEPQGVIHSREQLLPFINLEWILILLLIFVSTEWFLRKYHGSY